MRGRIILPRKFRIGTYDKHHKAKKSFSASSLFFSIFHPHPDWLCSFVSVQASQGKVLAEIDGKKIMQKDFDAYLALFKGNSRYLPKTLEDKKRLLHHLIDRAILLEAARKEGYFKQDTLKKHPSFNQVEKETFVLRAYLMDHVSGKITVTSSEIAAFKKNPPQNHTPGSQKHSDNKISKNRIRISHETSKKRACHPYLPGKF